MAHAGVQKALACLKLPHSVGGLGDCEKFLLRKGVFFDV